MFGNTKEKKKVANLEEKVQELEVDALKHLNMIYKLTQQVLKNQTNINKLYGLAKKTAYKVVNSQPSKQGGKKKTRRVKKSRRKTRKSRRG
jgi:hypothetical protein